MKIIRIRAFKDGVYGAFAEVTKALSNPKRLELLDLLVQGPRSVESLAGALGQSVGNTSQHLQVLKRSRVVQTRRLGTTIEYSLAPGVEGVFVSLRRLAEARSPTLVHTKQTYFAGAEAEEVVDRDELRRRLADGTAILLDVRPSEEFAHAHVEGALSIPIEQLEARLEELPVDQLVVATCRGPYCVFATDAVQALRRAGRAAARFEDGVGEWRADGGTVSASP